MQLEILKNLIARVAETRKNMYFSHDKLKLNRNPENFQLFVKSVDDFNKTLQHLPDYMRTAPYCHPSDREIN